MIMSVKVSADMIIHHYLMYGSIPKIGRIPVIGKSPCAVSIIPTPFEILCGFRAAADISRINPDNGPEYSAGYIMRKDEFVSGSTVFKSLFKPVELPGS